MYTCLTHHTFIIPLTVPMPPKRKYAAAISSGYQAAKARSIKRRRTARVNQLSRPVYTNVIRQRVQLGRGPIPASSVVTLRYSTSVEATGSNQEHVFNLNSIFDPDRTGTGHQPLGRDQYAALYNRYRVLSCRARIIMCINAGILQTEPIVGCIVADNAGTAFSDFDTACEQQGSMTKCLGTGGGSITFARTFDCAKITGVTPTAYKDDRFQALMSADPAEIIALHILFSKVFGGQAPAGTVRIRVILDYKTELFDPLPIAGS